MKMELVEDGFYMVEIRGEKSYGIVINYLPENLEDLRIYIDKIRFTMSLNKGEDEDSSNQPD